MGPAPMVMRLAYLQRFSLIDYPGALCATLFTRGCTFRCPWCHNPELAAPVAPETVEDDFVPGAVLDFLETRRGKLDALTITGGEPTIQGEGLLSFARAVKDMGFLLKIDTNGSRPDMLRRLLDERLVDYIAMDVKGPLDRYESLAGVAVDPATIRRSIEIIMNEAPDYEFRTTVARSLLSPDALEETSRTVEGAGRYFLQKMGMEKTLDPSFMGGQDYEPEEIRHILARVRRFVPAAETRGW